VTKANARGDGNVEEKVKAANKASNSYRATCKKKKAAWHGAVTDQVEQIAQSGMNNTWIYANEILGIKKTDTITPPIAAVVKHLASVFHIPGVPTDLTQPSPSPATPTDHTVEYVTAADVTDVLKTVLRDKASGWDGIPSAMLTDLRDADWFVSLLHNMTNVFIHNGFWPSEWNEIVIAPIPKPGKPPTEPESYRPIHLICVLAKCVSAMIERHLRKVVDTCREQLGFQAGSGTRDNAFVLRELIGKYRTKGLFTCFVDFKMAFDSIDRTLLFDKLAKLPGMDPVWIRMLRAMYTNVRACVKGSGVWIHENIGVKQGDPLSPLLFLLYIHDLPDALVSPTPPKSDLLTTPFLAQQLMRCLLYADDLALPSLTADGLQTLLGRLHDYCQKWKLTVNVPKTKIVIFSSKRLPPPLHQHTFMYDSQRIECVNKFKYVGVWFNRTGLARDTFTDILSASRQAMYTCIGRVTRLGPIPPRLKIALFNAYVRPVMLYCTEALPLSKSHLAQLDKLQLQYIRWSLGKLPQSSSRIDTLAETGQLPVSHDAVRARIGYYLLVKSRPDSHITTAALAGALTAPQKQDNWWNLVQTDLKLWEMPDLDTQLAKETAKEKKQTIARHTKAARSAHWQNTIKGDPPHTPDWCTATTLTEHTHTRVLPLHLTDHRSTRWYKSQFSPNYHRVPAPYIAATIHLPTHSLRALCTFRLGIAKLHVHTGTWKTPVTPLLDRTCAYCDSECGQKAVEDPYHVCMECPLYECARVELYNKLRAQKFDFTSTHTLTDTYTSLMNVGQPDAVRSVGRFLADCMAIRDTYHGHTTTSHWITTANKKFARACVYNKPTTCDRSFALLKQPGYDVTTCKTAASYQTHTQNNTGLT
jgi:hypothetical protein